MPELLSKLPFVGRAGMLRANSGRDGGLEKGKVAGRMLDRFEQGTAVSTGDEVTIPILPPPTHVHA